MFQRLPVGIHLHWSTAGSTSSYQHCTAGSFPDACYHYQNLTVWAEIWRVGETLLLFWEKEWEEHCLDSAKNTAEPSCVQHIITKLPRQWEDLEETWQTRPCGKAASPSSCTHVPDVLSPTPLHFTFCLLARLSQQSHPSLLLSNPRRRWGRRC